MLKNKKLRLAALAFGACAAVLSAPTFAYRGGCMSDGPMGGKFADGRFADRMKQHQQRLHDALKLTPEQETAWTKLQESHPFMGHAMQSAPVDWAKMTAPERADKMLELQKQHQDAMAKHVAAMKDFYAQLTPEQKKVFDEQTLMGRRGPRSNAPQGPGNPPPAN